MTDVAGTNKIKVQGGGQSAQEESQDHGSLDKNSVHSRLRANSSIMNLKKIMGESSRVIPQLPVYKADHCPVANRGEIPIRVFRTAHELSQSEDTFALRGCR